ncbi:hypothetical protein [Thiohalorhabdus methylotrophus]|uniref:DUF3137 domain-containing protein n=1 Tax=Thiohalorhabdus methylotrophus TaxID=3242694 RepID=A0ABV4TUV7_9GAMM
MSTTCEGASGKASGATDAVLERLDSLRIRLRNEKRLKLFLPAGLTFFAVYWGLGQQGIPAYAGIIAGLFAAPFSGLIAYTLLRNRKQRRTFETAYHRDVTRPLLEELLPQARFLPEEGIGAEVLRASGLFQSGWSHYESRRSLLVDKAAGRFRLAEVAARSRDNTADAGTGRRIVFQGLFLHGKLNRSLGARVVAVPREGAPAFSSALAANKIRHWRPDREDGDLRTWNAGDEAIDTNFRIFTDRPEAAEALVHGVLTPLMALTGQNLPLGHGPAFVFLALRHDKLYLAKPSIHGFIKPDDYVSVTTLAKRDRTDLEYTRRLLDSMDELMA